MAHVFYLTACLAIAGCTTTKIDEMMPAQPAAIGPQSGSQGISGESETSGDGQLSTTAGATDPDGFPNLNRRPHAQAEQFSDDDKAAVRAKLEKARSALQVQGGAPVADVVKDLQALAEDHGSETLREIEKPE